jgi:ABC-type transport system substrate-binding protein
MRSKLLRLLAVLLAFTLVATACGGDDSDDGDSADGGTGEEQDDSGLPDTFPDLVEPTKGGRLVMAMNDNIDCYSGLSYYGISWALFYFMARGLYGYPNTIEAPETDTIQADLAEDLPEVSDDGLTYTVKLREGLTFPDGAPVTSADVKATFEYMLDPNIQCSTGGPPSSGYYNVIEGVDEYSAALEADSAAQAEISGIKVVDDLTTEFTLTKPDGAFVRALAMGWSFIRRAPRTRSWRPRRPSSGPTRSRATSSTRRSPSTASRPGPTTWPLACPRRTTRTTSTASTSPSACPTTSSCSS